MDMLSLIDWIDLWSVLCLVIERAFTLHLIFVMGHGCCISIPNYFIHL